MSNVESLFASCPPTREKPVKPGDDCPRCEGKGHGSWRPKAGICFRCWGAGVELDPKEKVMLAQYYRDNL